MPHEGLPLTEKWFRKVLRSSIEEPVLIRLGSSAPGAAPAIAMAWLRLAEASTAVFLSIVFAEPEIVCERSSLSHRRNGADAAGFRTASAV